MDLRIPTIEEALNIVVGLSLVNDSSWPENNTQEEWADVVGDIFTVAHLPLCKGCKTSVKALRRFWEAYSVVVNFGIISPMKNCIFITNRPIDEKLRLNLIDKENIIIEGSI